MRNVFLPLALIAAIGFGGAAFAGNNAPVNSTSGGILLLQAGGVLLEDGSRFVLPASVNVTNITEGELVTVKWQQSGNVKVITSVSHAM